MKPYSFMYKQVLYTRGLFIQHKDSLKKHLSIKQNIFNYKSINVLHSPYISSN